MAAFSREMAQLAGRFAACRRTRLVLGDKKRQHLILKMLQMKGCTRAIAEKCVFLPRSISSSAHIRGCRHHPRAAERNKKLLFFSF
ncbi:MAG: hypothetical protein ACLVAA_07350 [Ruthenibacterium sp.]